MFADFFIQKAKGVLSFLYTMKGEEAGEIQIRQQGQDETQSGMNAERAYNVDSEFPVRNSNPTASGSDRDISAY